MSMSQRRVLLMGANRSLCSKVRHTLQANSFVVQLLAGSTHSPGACTLWPPDLLIVDLSGSPAEAPATVRRLSTSFESPLLALTASGGAAPDTLVAAGADDFLAAPFDDAELLARIRLVLARSGRRAHVAQPTVLIFGGLRIDLSAQSVTRDGRPVALSRTDWVLLEVLARNAGRVMTARTLYQQIWDDLIPDGSSILRTYVGRLRRKLEDDPRRPRYLLTEPRLGYRFTTPEAELTPV
jgi:two-component system, OmpR family, KDP operon response regulator KdpE